LTGWLPQGLIAFRWHVYCLVAYALCQHGVYEWETGKAVALEKRTMREGEMRHGAHSDEQWELRE